MQTFTQLYQSPNVRAKTTNLLKNIEENLSDPGTGKDFLDRVQYKKCWQQRKKNNQLEFFVHAHSMGKFQSQESNPRYSSDNTQSLALCATRELFKMDV